MSSNPASAEVSVLASCASVRRYELYDPPQLSKKKTARALRDRGAAQRRRLRSVHQQVATSSARATRSPIAPLRAGTSRARGAPTSGVPKEEPTRDVTPINFRFLLSLHGSPRSARPMEARSS
ncbi:hypothetical protein MRX96_034673 [Rhipicephalus microplus]